MPSLAQGSNFRLKIVKISCCSALGSFLIFVRNQLRHPKYAKPELLAEGPNRVWSWDITKLKGPVKWTYYYLYVILDIFSRYVVGWMVASRELGILAKKLIEQSCEKQGIQSSQLSIHSDRGPSMTSKPVAFLLADLGIT